MLHAAYMTFVVFGQAAILLGLVFRWTWIRIVWFRTLHLVAIAIVWVEEIFGVVCPLTTLEDFLRAKAGQTGYTGDFIGHWVHELIFFDAPPWAFTMCYFAFGLVVLATFLLAPPCLSGSRSNPISPPRPAPARR